jgi:anaerobic selenocysteine-containing dehydrogenase
MLEAEPEVRVGLNGSDAEEHGFAPGDLLRAATPRGAVKARLRIGGIRPGADGPGSSRR